MWSIICNMIRYDFEKDIIPWWVLVETDEVDVFEDYDEITDYDDQKEMSLEERFRTIQGELHDIKEQLCTLYDVLGEDKEL